MSEEMSEQNDLVKQIRKLDPTTNVHTQRGDYFSSKNLLKILQKLLADKVQTISSPMPALVKSPSGPSDSSTVPSSGPSTGFGTPLPTSPPSSTVEDSKQLAELLSLVKSMNETMATGAAKMGKLESVTGDYRDEVAQLRSQLESMAKKADNKPASQPKGTSSRPRPRSPMVFRDPRGGGDDYDDDDVYEDGAEYDRHDDDAYSVHSETSRKQKLLTKGQEHRDDFESFLKTMLLDGRVISPTDFKKLLQKFEGLPFWSSTGHLLLRKVANKGTKKMVPSVSFTTMSGSGRDPSYVPGPTLQDITVSPVARSLGELDVFFDEQLHLLCNKDEYEGTLTAAEALVAIGHIMKFKKDYTYLFTSVLGPEGPTLGGSDSQWTDWFALVLMLWSLWNRSLLEKDYSLLNSAFQSAATSTRIHLSRGESSFGRPVLNLKDALLASDHQCSDPKCCSTEGACDQVCFMCTTKRLEPLEPHHLLSFEKWEEKLPADQKSKSKAEKNTQYAEYKERKKTSTITDLNTYIVRLSSKQGVIGPPSNLVGPTPRPIVKGNSR